MAKKPHGSQVLQLNQSNLRIEIQNPKNTMNQSQKLYLQLLEEEYRGSVGRETVDELETAVQEADGAVIAADNDSPPPA